MLEPTLHQEGYRLGPEGGRKYEIQNSEPIGGGSFSKVYLAKLVPQNGIPKLTTACQETWNALQDTKWVGRYGVKLSSVPPEDPKLVAIKVIDKEALMKQTPAFLKVKFLGCVVYDLKKVRATRSGHYEGHSSSTHCSVL